MSFPTLIQGPAIVTHNGNTYRSKGDITVKHSRDTFDVETALHGKIDTRLKSQKFEISFQPDGALAGLGGLFPWIAGTAIGDSIFTGSALPLVIQGRDGKKLTFARAGLSKMPAIRLKATDTLFGDMAFTALAPPTVDLDDADAWHAVAANAFSDTTFDETKVKTARYLAAYGAAAPYDAIASLDGFEIEVAMETQNIEVDSYGLVDVILKSLQATAKFIPYGLTVEEITAMIALHDEDAILPGDSLAKADTDLVISAADVFTATLHKAGVRSSDLAWGVGKPRAGELAFSSRRSWTAGTANPLITLTIPA
ncbi:hypothetical protein HUU05_09665 [candidate division KSB1 bacterium]|nr:hypothetical protein [candidate division KSB1 bacterium]